MVGSRPPHLETVEPPLTWLYVNARFTCNFVVMVVGAGLLVSLFAFSTATSDWIAVGVGFSMTPWHARNLRSWNKPL